MSEKNKNLGNAIRGIREEGFSPETTNRIPTGIKTLDDALNGGLSVELIGIAGAPGEGKTTLVQQIAESASGNSCHVLEFSTESTAEKMMACSISRASYKKDPKKALTSVEVIERCKNDEEDDSELDGFITDAAAACENITVYDCSAWDHRVETIVDEVTKYREEHPGEKLLVILDYLNETYAPKDDFQKERKDIIDHCMISLKQLSENLKIPILVICAINRDEGYEGPVSISGLKDSGRLEYNFDLILGIERLAQNYDNLPYPCSSDRRTRDVRIDILKQKDGIANVGIRCTYHAAYNFFESHEDFFGVQFPSAPGKDADDDGSEFDEDDDDEGSRLNGLSDRSVRS